jgi:tetraacyldisaccharide 4'-kinase
MKAWNDPGQVALLTFPAALYGGAVRVRNLFYDRAGASSRADLPVLSIGNLTAGGTGKTTMVAFLARVLLAWGRSPAVVSRGYGGRAGRGPLVVSSGGGATVGPERAGDEPYLLAQTLPGVRVVVGSDRIAGASAAKDLGADVVILDDGFQHRRLARDLDIVLLDAAGPFGNYHLLPAGPLREPISGLSRADVVVITRSRPGESFVVLERVVRRYNVRCPILRSANHRVGFVDASGTRAARPERAVAFCGIGNPASFLVDLEAEGLSIAGFHPFPDHHRYSDTEWKVLLDEARRGGCGLVTTEKDLARLGPLATAPGAGGLLALRIEAVVHDESKLFDAVREALARGEA